MICAEYIWIDGYKPTAKLRSKTKVVDQKIKDISELPDWSFDGSSTLQAEGHFSDCLLVPVSFFKDPIRGGDNILVMCEVMNADGTVHESNHRAALREVAEKYADQDAWFGVEQEYTFFEGIKPIVPGFFRIGIRFERIPGRSA